MKLDSVEVPPAEISTVSVAELRQHHERALGSIVDLMLRTLNIRAAAVWDDANNALMAAPENGASALAVKTLRSSWSGIIALDAPPTLRSTDGRERLMFTPIGTELACLCIELRTSSKRRRGAVCLVRDSGATFTDILPLLGDFAAAIEAQCELFTAAVSIRLALLEAAARAATSTAGADFPKSVDLRGSLARYLPQCGLLVFDHDLRYLRAEGDILNRFGTLSRDDFEGATLYDIVSSENRGRLEQLYREALAGASQRFEVRYANRVYECQTMPVHDVSSAIVAAILLIHDVTDSRALDARLRRSAARVDAVTDTAT